MKKLKIKVFSILFFILTTSLIVISVIFNYQEYKKEETSIKETLSKVANMSDKEEIINIINSEREEPVFMDSIVYTIKLSNDNKVLYIISHTYDEENQEKVLNYINEILEKEKNLSYGTRKIYIGNLYFANYSYSFEQGNRIVIVDNMVAKDRLLSTFRKNVLITSIMELLVIIASIKLTGWIIKPALESFNKQKQFVEDASHELKTPLTIIMANVENLDMDEKNNKWIYNIKSEADRMNKLIMQLLDLAKMENKKQEEYSIENLSKVVEKTVLTFESLTFEKHIELETNIEENISFKFNSDDIKQLMTILIDNAIVHSYEKDGKIIVSLVKDKNDIILKVSNKGESIPKEEEEKIFERFYKRDTSRNRDTNNYGLGLAIAKSIVSNYGGNITAHSENEYTTFKVVLK